jgi:hypothetical protein
VRRLYGQRQGLSHNAQFVSGSVSLAKPKIPGVKLL